VARPTLALAALTLLLSGCAQTGLDVAPDASIHTTLGPDPDVLPVPEDVPRPWHVGDWWTYHYTSHLDGVPDTDMTLVVAEDQGSTWTLTTTAPANATFFTHVPSLGPIRKADLAVTRHGHPVPFLQFPLTEGATWPVEVRGPWAATAHRANLTIGSLRVPGWRIEYRAGETLQHVIEWSAHVGWMATELAYQGEDTPRHELRLTAWGSNHTGPLKVYEASDVLVQGHFYDASQPQANEGSEQFSVGSDGQGLLLGVFMGGGSGTCFHAFTSPAGTNENRGGGGPCGDAELVWVERPLSSGTWTSNWVVNGEGAYVFVEVQLLHIRDAR